MPAPEDHLLGGAGFLAVGRAGDFIFSLLALFDDLYRHFLVCNGLSQWTFKSAHRGDKNLGACGYFCLGWRRLGWRLLRACGFAVPGRQQQEHSEQFPMFHFSSPSSLCKILPGCLRGAISLPSSPSGASRTPQPRSAFPCRNSLCARRTRKPLHCFLVPPP